MQGIYNRAVYKQSCEGTVRHFHVYPALPCTTYINFNQGKNIMLTEIQLKEKLQALAQDKFHLSGNDDLSEMIPAMLNHIGSTDSYLRDDLIYSAFGTWILRYNAIDREHLRNLLPIILDEQHILYKIGEHNTDSVFTRSFSILLLPLLLITHRSQPLLSAPEIDQIKEKLLYYLENEKDRRGFVTEKGWAHAIAHAADALDDLAQCSEMNKSDLVEILEAIRKVICIEGTAYIHLEDERMVTAVMAIMKRQLLTDAEIVQWLDAFSTQTLTISSAPERHVIRANVKNFLQSLYFRLQWEQVTNKFDAPINQTLQKINPFHTPEGG